MFANENFALQNTTLLQCTLHGCQLFSLISAKRNAFYAKWFPKYKIISVHRKRCKPRTVGPDLQRIFRFSSVYPPKFLFSQRLKNS